MKVSPYQQADRMLAQRKIPREGHELLRENLASSLAQGPGDRWTKKIERDLENPYSDREVFAHLHKLEALSLQLAPFSTGTWHVFGSIPKGRFGANSDLDVNCEGGLAPENIEALKALPGWKVNVFPPICQSDPRQLNSAVESEGLEVTASFQHGQQLNERLSRFDGQVAIRPEPGYLTELYTQALHRKGYQVEHDPLRVVPPTQPVEPAAEMTWNLAGMPSPSKEESG